MSEVKERENQLSLQINSDFTAFEADATSFAVSSNIQASANSIAEKVLFNRAQLKKAQLKKAQLEKAQLRKAQLQA